MGSEARQGCDLDSSSTSKYIAKVRFLDGSRKGDRPTACDVVQRDCQGPRGQKHPA